MKLVTFAAAITIPLFAALTVGERECPLESDCIQKLCKNFNYNTNWNGNRAFMMEAYCKNEAGTMVLTKLDLKKCIANDDGLLQWSPELDSPEEYVGLRCNLCPKKNTFWRGYKWTWINLSRGIWVSKSGTLGCYGYEGERHELLKKIS
ncbi:cvnh domain-containing protein [Colletotrichum incanum]|uniref:Cvnh domain-containing protein n=1 Tax=Colletotrichum incanum TaxID=1573173 RepID=A0A166VD98_COLIC|nr:cvnh domain-containing protein [Colletotrichum incanum]